MRTVSTDELKEALKKHKMWLGGKAGGARLDLSSADLSSADLSGADLRYANLSYADLSYADLSSADLRGSRGLLDPAEWLKSNLEQTPDGYICYKSVGSQYSAPAHWEQKPGAILTEVVNPLPTLDCACGVNVAKKDWSGLPESGVWKVLIRWEWLPSVVIPYNTDGKFRCGKCELLEELIR